MLLEMLVVGVLASAVGIALALTIHWFPPAASTQAGPIDTLWDVLLIVSIPIFVGVCVVVGFSVREFRMKPGQELEDGPPIHGNTRLEIVWTALPALLLVSLCTYAFLVLHDIEKAPAQADKELRVTVTGQQFAWHFTYPQAGGKAVESDQLYLPVDRSVKFDVLSKDVLHDFFVPAFRMKIDAVPGITTNYRVTPKRLGVYPVVCAELCGLGHAFMRQTAHVVSAGAFSAWIAKQSGGPGGAAAGQSGSASKKPDAKMIFTSGNGTSTACGSCHTLADAGTSATTGPDLGKALAGQSVAMIREDIVTPDKVITKGYPAHVMPQDFAKTLSGPELTALVNYLHEVTAK